MFESKKNVTFEILREEEKKGRFLSEWVKSMEMNETKYALQNCVKNEHVNYKFNKPTILNIYKKHVLL